MDNNTPEILQKPSITEGEIHLLDIIMARIEANSNNENEGGVFPFKEKKGQVPTEKLPVEQQAANQVYDMLMYTLGEIGAYAVDQAKGTGPHAQEYQEVAKAIDPMTAVARGLADDKIPLTRNTKKEGRHAEIGDIVYAYSARNFVLGQLEIDGTTVFIRPKTYIKPMNLQGRAGRYRTKMQEYQDPRLKIDIYPKDTRYGLISFRVDQEDLEKAMEITYDIEVIPRPGGENLMDKLNFKEAGEREPHHFGSKYTVEQLKVEDFAKLLNTFNSKFAQNAARNQSTTGSK